MMDVNLLRHGSTAGNEERRYVGRTDEPLSPEGAAYLRGRAYPAADRVLVSPMRRCIESAACVYPALPILVEPDFREMDFGEFEYRNYAELSGDARYQAYIDSYGEAPFPGGESRARFTKRSTEAFIRWMGILERADVHRAAFVVHGGTIMAVLAAFSEPASEYFSWQIKPAEGFTAHWTGEKLTNIARIDTQTKGANNT